jgi:tRNA pseudouridine38-40 synthase
MNALGSAVTMTLFEPELPDLAATPTVRVRLDVAYDGTNFHGYAENVGVRTVAGVLREALERVLRHKVELTGAGRTDRGVHARGQVVTFDAHAERFDPVALQRSLNKLLGPAISVGAVGVAADDFDARFSATARLYRYRVLNTPAIDPLLARSVWHVGEPLDLNAMRLAADPLIGEHDFSSFCRRPSVARGGAAESGEHGPPIAGGVEVSLCRQVRRAVWRDRGEGLLEFEIEASSFCHQMVRSIVGTLVEMGLGRRRAGEMVGIIAARDRNAAGRMAPPQGLILWEVRY